MQKKRLLGGAKSGTAYSSQVAKQYTKRLILLFVRRKNPAMQVPRHILAAHPEMIQWRRDLHAHPELGFEQFRTSDFIADKLRSLGMEVHRGVGKTGLVGVLISGAGKRSIGLRADMDALPIQEQNSFEHRSQHAETMHACGHDGHTVMLLGAADYLPQTRKFDGTVHFIFQPGEEGVGGAKAMLQDGLFDKFPCEAIFALHNRPSLPVGEFSSCAGAILAGGAFPISPPPFKTTTEEISQ